MPTNDQVTIFDTTLRDGEQAPGAAMTLDEKIQIARQLAELRVDIIEAGFPISSPGQAEAVRRIASEVEGPVICGLARATEDDIRAAGEALKPGARTRIHTFIATSDIHIDAKFSHPRFGATLEERRRTIIRMAVDAIRLARTYTDDVEFSAEDAGRTDIAYLCEIVQAAVEAGATTINLPDTTGYCIPTEYSEIFTSVMACLERPQDIVFSTHCHDDLGLAVANSIAGVQAGARQIECTINGIGERAGNASLEEVVMALHVRSPRFGLKTNIQTQKLMATSEMIQVATGFPVPPNKAIVGRNAFSHEAGIHQHGVLKRRDTYEIMRAEDVGQAAEQIRLGRHSGRHGFFSRLDKLGIRVADDQREAMYARFVELADRKKEILEEDLYHLVDARGSVAVDPDYTLKAWSASVGTHQKPDARVDVYHRRLEGVRTGQATGDGPVDALYGAIDQAVGTPHELIHYSLRSVTEGADALGEVHVLIEHGGTHFRGMARSTDVLEASAMAYVEALNHLAAFLTEEESVAFVGNGIIQSFDSDPR